MQHMDEKSTLKKAEMYMEWIALWCNVQEKYRVQFPMTPIIILKCL